MIAPSRISCSSPQLSGSLVELSRSHAGAGNEPLSEIRQRLAQTPSLLHWTELLSLVAEYDVPVLITGETGAGKTWLARIIHDCSPRRNEPFVIVPCGALSAQLVESEFFGHVRGAFTGADSARAGKIEAAGRGTLLLDEIDMLSPEQQAKLLRVLDSGEYEPVGSNKTRLRNCRIITASNIDLEAQVRRGAFRSDLYYRLQVLPFHLPPLRQRVQDVAPLAKSLAAHYSEQFSKELLDISPETLAMLEAYSWPGNLRELDNAMRQAVLLSRGEALLPGHLPDKVRGRQAISDDALCNEREDAERALIRRVLSNADQNRSRAARQLGISRVTLLRKMKKYGLASA